MEHEPTQDEAERRVREVAHRLLTTPKPKKEMADRTADRRSSCPSPSGGPPASGAARKVRRICFIKYIIRKYFLTYSSI